MGVGRLSRVGALSRIGALSRVGVLSRVGALSRVGTLSRVDVLSRVSALLRDHGFYKSESHVHLLHEFGVRASLVVSSNVMLWYLSISISMFPKN